MPCRPVEADDVSDYVNLFRQLADETKTGNCIDITEVALGKGLFDFNFELIFVDFGYSFFKIF